VQVLESIKDLFKHRDSLGLHFGHKWLMHFGCVNGLLGLYHPWGFISRRGTYQWSSSFGRHPGCFGHFVFMCRLLTFLSHLDNVSSLFFFVSFGEFRQDIYANMWGHYGCKVMRVYSGPLSKVSSLTTNLFWWYRPLFMEVCSPSTFLESWALVALYSTSFVFSINPSWRSMSLKWKPPPPL
jgi:hypothetical protein